VEVLWSSVAQHKNTGDRHNNLFLNFQKIYNAGTGVTQEHYILFQHPVALSQVFFI
jgi:hypothetical protein